jgi:cytochrome b pre-mRNA-processing protein 3
MLPPLFRRSPKPTIASLYGAIVAQARAPRFYEDYAVPDTVLGRFDMVVLHVVLIVRRLRDGSRAQQTLAQALFDAFCRDIDQNLREMGISDQGVPKHMQRVGEAFYGRAKAYEAALGADRDRALVEALLRNIYAGVAEAEVAAVALAHYVRGAAQHLADQGLKGLEAGIVRFPEPAPLARVE